MTLTGGEVDISKEDDVGGDQRDELSDANLLFEMDVHHVVFTQSAVHWRMKLFQTGSETAYKPVQKDTQEMLNIFGNYDWFAKKLYFHKI